MGGGSSAAAVHQEQASRRGWALTLAAAIALGVTSLLANLTSAGQLQGREQEWLAVRRTLSLLLNSGSVWAGLGVFAGWCLRRPVAAALGSALSLALALAVHYLLGIAVGSLGWESFSRNGSWFLAAAVVGPVLGLVGATTHSDRWFGLLARLFVPAGAVVEPWVRQWWSAPATTGWPTVASGWAASVLLTAAGLAGAWVVLSRRSAPTV